MASRHRFVVNGRERTVVVDEVSGRTTVAIDDGEPVEVDATTSGLPGGFSLVIDGAPSRAHVLRRAQGFEVAVDGRRFEVLPAGAAARGRGVIGGADDPLGKVTAPLAGVVVSVSVAVGDRIDSGQLLLTLEAMKMQNEVHATRTGVVTAVLCEQGGRVERGEVVLEYDADE
jgi:biotin carboxyl carrier protein